MEVPEETQRGGKNPGVGIVIVIRYEKDKIAMTTYSIISKYLK